jgi:hypothetical protein
MTCAEVVKILLDTACGATTKPAPDGSPKRARLTRDTRDRPAQLMKCGCRTRSFSNSNVPVQLTTINTVDRGLWITRNPSWTVPQRCP